MIRIGIIGTGSHIGMAGSHIDAYQQCGDAVITAVYDIERGCGAGYIEKYGLTDATDCTGLQQLFDLCDAVSVCTPNCTHVPITVQALNAGKHVLCEKPFAPTPEECDEAIAAADAAGLVGMIGLCYRDIPGFVYMKKLIDEGKLGKIYFAREEQGGDRIASPAVQLEWRMQKSQSGPGALADFGSHMMDICDYLLRGSCGPIGEIQCMQGTYIEQREIIGKEGSYGAVDNDDVACWNCRTENGTLYSFTASRIGATFMLEIVGEGGKMIFDGSDPFALTLQLKDKDGGYVSRPERFAVPESCYGTDASAPRKPFAINMYYEIRQFLDAIESGKETLLTLRRGRYIQTLIEAAQQAAETGKIVKVTETE